MKGESRTSRRVEAVIFDMDGLMVNSEDLWEETERLYFTRKGHTYSNEEFDGLLMGRKKEESAAVIKERLGLEDSIEAIISDRFSILRTLCEERLELMPGLLSLLDSLVERRVPLALASSSTMDQIHFVLDRFDLRRHFPTILSGDMVSRGKPAPDIYLMTAERLGKEPSVCLALEDTVNGARAAKAAGMICFAIPDKRQQGLDFSMADGAFASLEELDADTVLSFKPAAR
ncbi:HAD family phosphatase [Nitrospinae bacterium AH_259_B05_G02_I21]|nr:HAD family phosphatase [Nitrospinae bacterium AH_259_B05_G02_I21]MDA2932134.1 HAD family phosphatase [Nitrospinae bacterium AH-259-F20]